MKLIEFENDFNRLDYEYIFILFIFVSDRLVSLKFA